MKPFSSVVWFGESFDSEFVDSLESDMFSI